ncbi:MAG: zinc ribbon domain-containing protein [Clostridiales bacterium]|nr:zinc ribbon domain-containing protein [Clostridiales bacterium]
MKHCPSCGYADSNDNAKFCTECGAAYPQNAETTAPEAVSPCTEAVPAQPEAASTQNGSENGSEQTAPASLLDAYYQQLMEEKKKAFPYGAVIGIGIAAAVVLTVIGFLLT